MLLMKGHFRLMPLSAMPSIISSLTCLCSCTHSNSVTLICPDPFPLPCVLHMNQSLSQCLEQGTLLRRDNTMFTNQEGLLFLPRHFRSLIYSLCVFLFMTSSHLPVYLGHLDLMITLIFFPPCYLSLFLCPLHVFVFSSS